MSFLKYKHYVLRLKDVLHIWSRSQELEQCEMVLRGMKASCFGYFLSVFTIYLESIAVSNVTDSAKSLIGT